MLCASKYKSGKGIEWIFSFQKEEIRRKEQQCPSKFKDITDINVRDKSTKFLEDILRASLYYLVFGNGFLNRTPKVQQTKKPTALYQNYCASKNTFKKKTTHRMKQNICK